MGGGGHADISSVNDGAMVRKVLSTEDQLGN